MKLGCNLPLSGLSSATPNWMKCTRAGRFPAYSEARDSRPGQLIRAPSLISWRSSVYSRRASLQVIHQHILTERHCGREVCLALADFSNLPDKVDKIVIIRKHKRVDHDSAATAGGHLAKCLAQN